MKKIVLASHSYLASGMLDAVELIVGPQENIYPICAYVDDLNHVGIEIKNYIDQLNVEDEVIIVSDLFGGSVNNEILAVLSKYKSKNIHLVSGMSLGLVLTLITLMDSEKSTNVIIQEAIEQSNKLVTDNTRLIFSNGEENDEDDDIKLDELS